MSASSPTRCSRSACRSSPTPPPDRDDRGLQGKERHAIASLAAGLFVLIWSTGFVVARGIAQHVDPYAFLFVRFLLVFLLFAATAAILRLPRTTPRVRWHLLGVGALMQGLYLGPGFWAVGNGLEAGVMALIGSLQPPLTAVLAHRLFGERLARTTLIGLALGIVGVAMAVSPTLGGEPAPGGGSIPAAVVAAGVLSILSITAGTLLQKSPVREVHLVSASAWQTLGAVLVMAVLLPWLGRWQFPVDVHALGLLAYAVLVLSIGGFTLLTWMVRRGSVTRVSSLLLLVPPLTALLGWWLFDEPLAPVQLAGFVLALAGVALARRMT